MAEQHHQGLHKLVESLPAGVRPTLALLTGDTKQADRKKVSEMLADGSLQLLIGTHALLHEKEPFKNLGLAIIDEQHKYVAGRSPVFGSIAWGLHSVFAQDPST